MINTPHPVMILGRVRSIIMKNKKLICLIMTVFMVANAAVPAFADTESDIREQRSIAKEALSETKGAISELKEQQQAIQQEIDGIDADIVDLMIQIDQAKQDIETTQAQIE